MTVQPFKTQGDAGAKLANLLITGQTVAVTGAGQPLTLGLADQTSWVFDTDGATVLPQGGLIAETAGSIIITPADFGGAENTAWYSVFGDQKIPRTGNVDYGASTAYDSTGNLYVIGGHVDTSNYLTGDNIALKYDQYGNLLVRKAWTTPEGMPCGSVHSALKIDRSTDAIYWASTEVTQEFNAFNSYVGVMDTELNITTAPLLIRNIVVQEIQINEPGILTIGGTYVEIETGFPVLAKINLNINQLVWVSRADAIGDTEYNGSINSIAIDGLGNTWAVGSYQPNGFYNSPFLARFGTDGVNTGFWNIASLSENDGNIYGVSVAINDGYLYTLLNVRGSSDDSVIAKWDISDDPTRIWVQAIDLGGVTFANNMQFDDGGDLYLVGQTYDVPVYSDCYVAKIDPDNGSAIWQRTFGSNGSNEGVSPTGFITKYVDILGSNMAWTGATSTNPLDPGNYDGDYVITIQIPTDGSLTGQLGLFNYTEVDFPFTQPVGYDIVSVSASFGMVSPTVSTNTMIADSVLKSRRYIPYRYDLTNHAITRPYNWTFNDNGSTTMPNFFISGNIQNGGSRLGDSDQFLLLHGSGATVLQSRYNSGTPVVIQGANCPDGGLAGDVYVNAGHSEVPSNDGDTRQGNVFITAGPGAIWQFDSNAGLTFPDTSVQMTAWQGNAAIVSDTAPIAEYGAVWFNTLDARTYVNYNGTWVDANPTVLAPPSTYVGNLDIEGASITSVTIGEPIEINGWQFNDDGTVTASGDLVPNLDSIYSLGGADRQWKDLYVSNTTIYVGGTPISVVDGNLTVGGSVVSGNASGTSVEFPNGSYIRQINEEGVRIWQTDVGGDTNDAEYVALQYGGDPSSDDANVSITAGSYNWAIDDSNLTFFNYADSGADQGQRQINFDIRSSVTGRLLNWHMDETGNIYLPADQSVVSTSGIVFADGTLQTTAGGNASTGNITFTGSDLSSIDDADIRLVTNGNTWTFGTDGTTSFPNNAITTSNTPLTIQTKLPTTYGPFNGVYFENGNGSVNGVNGSGYGGYFYITTVNVNNDGTYSASGHSVSIQNGTNPTYTISGIDLGGTSPANDCLLSVTTVDDVITNISVSGTPFLTKWTFGTDGKLTLPAGGAFTSPDYNFSFNNDTGNFGVPTLGTVVTSEGGMDDGEVFMGSGYGEFRSIYNNLGQTSSGLVYAGVEGFNYAQYGDVNFAGMVSQTPNIDSMYTIGLNTSDQITIGFTQAGQTQQSTDWSVTVGTLNTDMTVNGLFANTNTTVIGSGLSSWTFGSTGNLTLPIGGHINAAPTVNYGNGNSIVLTAGSTNGCVSVAGSVVINAGNGNTIQKAGNILLNTQGGTWEFGANGTTTLPNGSYIDETAAPLGTAKSLDLHPGNPGYPNQYLKIYPTVSADADHLHLTSGDLTATELFLGDDEQYVKLTNNGNVEIRTGAFDYYNSTKGVWTFDSDGALTLPTRNATPGSRIKSAVDITIETGPYYLVDLVTVGGGSGGGIGVVDFQISSAPDWATAVAVGDHVVSGTWTQIITAISDLGEGRWRVEFASEDFSGVTNTYSFYKPGAVGGTWTFGADGTLTVPGAIKTPEGTGNVMINASNGVVSSWTFGGDGVLEFPDSTQQTTAYKRTTGSWPVATGSASYSFTVPENATYVMWVRGNISNGIIVWNATATVTNTNVPVIGQQYAWNYTGGGTPIEITAIPDQFIGTSNAIVSSNPSVGSTSNVFDFTINNTSGSVQTVYWGYVTQ